MTEKTVRFAAKGLRAQRDQLRLSQTDFGKLLGVSAQSIYNWERGETRPRHAQISKIAALRGIGKKKADERLKQLAGAKGNARENIAPASTEDPYAV